MGINRTSEQVIRDMLVAIAEHQPITKTKIMYRAYLSYTQLIIKLERMFEMQLISKKEKQFYITDAGLEYIEAVKRIENIGVQK